MLIVVPSEHTNPATSSRTPRRSRQHSMLTGSVAALLLLENASSCAGAIALKNRRYPTRFERGVSRIIITGYTTSSTTACAEALVKVYTASALSISSPSEATIGVISANTAYGAACISSRTRCSTASDIASQNTITVRVFSAGTSVRPSPISTDSVTTCSISACAIAANGFAGTAFRI